MRGITIDQRTRSALLIAAWVAIFSGGGYLLFKNIGHESLWYDEAYSLAVVNHRAADIIPLIGADSHPPLYFLMLRAFTLAFGRSEAAAKSLSALGMLALAGMGLFPLRRMWGNGRAMVYSILVFLTPMTIGMGQEARMYSWTAFFVAASAIGAFAWWKDGGRISLVLTCLASLAAAYSHYYGLMAVSFLWLILIVAAIASRRKRLLLLGIVALITVAGYAPWLILLAGQASRVASNYWIPPVTDKTIESVLGFFFGLKFGAIKGTYVVFWITVAFAAFGIGKGIWDKDRRLALPLAAIAVYALTLTTAVLVSRILRPILVERYMVSCLGLFILALAWGIGSLRPRPLWIVPLAAYAFFALPVIGKVHSLRYDGPMFEVREALKGLVKPEDVFIHSNEHNLGTFAYYFPNNKQYLYLPDGFVPFSNYKVFGPKGSSGPDIAQFKKEKGTLWLTENGMESYRMDASILASSRYRTQGYPIKEFSVRNSWYRVRVRGLDYVEADGPVDAAGPALLVDVKGLLSPTGNLEFSVYQSDASAPAIHTVPVRLEPGEADILVGGLKAGKVAVFVHHDENGNGMIDSHERTGFSAGAGKDAVSGSRGASGPPAFSVMAVDLGPVETRITVRLTDQAE